MTTLLYLMACLMSPAPLINLAESRVTQELHKGRKPIINVILINLDLQNYAEGRN